MAKNGLAKIGLAKVGLNLSLGVVCVVQMIHDTASLSWRVWMMHLIKGN